MPGAVASAHVELVPTFGGGGALTRSITEQLSGVDTGPAGKKAGTSFVTGMSGGIKGGAKLFAGAVAAMTGVSVAGLGGFVKASIDTGRQFDASMSQVSATLGMTTADIENNVGGAGETFQKLRDKAQEMGSATVFSASQAAEGLNILAMSGYSADESLEMVEDVLHLAAAGSMDMASAAGYVSGTMKGFNDSTKDAGYYADLMAKGATLANTDVQQLGEAMASGAAGAAAYGQSADGMTVSLLRLAEQGETGAAAGTALAAAMKNIYTPTDQAAQAMEKLGVKAYDQSGKAREFNTVVDELNGALSGMSAEEANAYKQTIFGIQGLDAYNKMVVTGTEKQEGWAEALAHASDGAGEASKQYDTMTDNLEGDIAGFQSAFEGVQVALSDSLTPAVREFVQWGTDGLGEISAALQTEEFKSFAEGTLDAVKGGIEGAAGAVKFLADNSSVAVPVIAGIAGGFVLLKGASGVAGMISTIGTVLPGIAASGAAAAGGLSATAGAETAAGAAAGASAGNMLRMGAAVLMIGGGVALAALGIGLLAQSAIALAESGSGAVAVMAGLGIGLAALVGVAALAGPALTAGAVGMLAFGAAALMVGAGIGLASAGISLLAAQLPTIAANGAAAATGILLIGTGLLVMGAGALVAGAGLMLIAPALLLATVAMAAFAPAMGLVAAGAGALGAALGVVAGAVVDVGNGAKNMGDGLTAAASAMPQIADNAMGAGAGILTIADSMGRANGSLSTGASAMASAGSGAQALASGVLVASAAANSAAASYTSMGARARSALTGIPAAVTSASAALIAMGSNGKRSFDALATSGTSAAQKVKQAIDSIPSSKTVRVNITHGSAPYPVYSVSGSLNPTAGTKPTYSVSWHYLAEGGILNQPVFVAGEAGAEVVAPLSELGSMLDESNSKYSGGDTYNINVNARTDADPEQIAVAISRSLKRYRMAV